MKILIPLIVGLVVALGVGSVIRLAVEKERLQKFNDNMSHADKELLKTFCYEVRISQPSDFLLYTDGTGRILQVIPRDDVQMNEGYFGLFLVGPEPEHRRSEMIFQEVDTPAIMKVASDFKIVHMRDKEWSAIADKFKRLGDPTRFGVGVGRLNRAG
jgi:hypothetical protein